MSSEPPPQEQEATEPEGSASPPREPARGGGGGGVGAGVLETNTLWVGNLHQQVSEADVMAAFSPHGALDCLIGRTGGARGYAFVLFRSAAEARAGLEALHGAKIKGSAIRIEFARPARAVKNLWVGGISPSIPKEELEEEFQKFGRIEGVAYSHDQTSAYMDFEKLEDAISAHRALNGTVLGGKELCVDFQRSRGRTEADVGNLNGRVSMQPGETRVGSAKGSAIRMREAQPTNVLWVGFPSTYTKINEEMLRRAMAAHGVVTNVKVFPTRQYAFVEFATIKEASNAKSLLDGRLFNDSRIQILFSNSELGPNKLDNLTPLAGFSRSDMYYSDGPSDYSGLGLGSHGTVQGYDPRRGRSRHGDYGGVSITGGILPSPESGPPFLTGRSAHDAFDPREAKRMRLDAGANPYDVRAGSEGLYPVGFSHQGVAVHAERSSSPAIRIQGTVHRTSFLEHFWRGSIAKGGSPVCRARCLPIRKGTQIPLPDIVNCSARTGLDMLAKHYGDASGFDIVFFLPDSEDDFVSYTEFLRYLGSKGRAGVVKVDVGTTLFLVPPSDFLTNVLQVDGPERLYGVVLHIPQMSAAVPRPQITGLERQPYYDGKETVFASQRNSSVDNQHQDADYRGSLHEDSLHRLGQVPARAPVDEGQAVQSILARFPANQTAGPQVQSSLKADVMSTLAKLMPSMQSSALVSGQVPLNSTDRPATSLMPDASTLSKVWKPENQTMASTLSFEHMSNLHQAGQQFSKQAPVTHLTNYGSLMGAQDHSTQHTVYNPEITLNLPPAPPPPTIPPSSTMLSSIGGHSLPTQVSQQQYQPEQYYASQNSYGQLTTAGHSNHQVSNNLPVPPPPQVNSGSLPANNQMGNLSQLQHATALAADRVSPDFSSQVQQQQNVASGAAQVPDEADKNKKYQATLQFAHSLLLQLQRGSGSQP